MSGSCSSSSGSWGGGGKRTALHPRVYVLGLHEIKLSGLQMRRWTHTKLSQGDHDATCDPV